MAYNFIQEICKIETKTASNSSTISFTSGIGTNFNVYLVKTRDVILITNSTYIQMLFSTDGGSTYLNSAYNWGHVSYGTGFGPSSGGGESVAFIQIGNALSNATNQSVNADITLYNLNNSSGVKICRGYTTGIGSGNVSIFNTVGLNTGTTAVNAIRFQMSSGNISSGTFTLYGVQEP